MAVLSTLNYTTIPTTCREYVHPWSNSCADAWMGLLAHAFQYSMRTYITVYLFTAIMRKKKPDLNMILNTLRGILQSTVFLTTHSYGFALCLCLLRKLTGSFNVLSVAFTPAFLSSIVAINLERPSRRPILCLYVTNVATETLFRMAVDRGWVKPIPMGEVIIFALSAGSLLYRFRGNNTKDSIFSLLKFVIGKDEGYQYLTNDPSSYTYDSPPQDTVRQPALKSTNQRSHSFSLINKAVQVYAGLIDKIKNLPKSKCCPHKTSCIHYVLSGGSRMLATGYGIQVLLSTVFSIRKIWKNPSHFQKGFLSKNVLNLGIFLGLFTSTFRGVSCILRWARGKDAREHAIPAGLLAGATFCMYPDNTAALYVMWKAIQLAYNDLIEQGVIPEIPYGLIIMYCFSTAVLFHAGFVEPKSLRPSYFKFLDGLSGGRSVMMDRRPLDAFGLETYKHHVDCLKNYKVNGNRQYPFSFLGKSNPIPPVF